MASRDRLRGAGHIVEPSRILAARPRGARRLRDSTLSTGGIFNNERNGPEATAESRIVTSANSGPLAKARRRSCRIRSALRRDQISENPPSPPFLFTTELIDVGAGSFLTPRVGPCSPRVLWPRPPPPPPPRPPPT